jgi:hypothetical protein
MDGGFATMAVQPVIDTQADARGMRAPQRPAGALQAAEDRS